MRRIAESLVRREYGEAGAGVPVPAAAEDGPVGSPGSLAGCRWPRPGGLFVKNTFAGGASPGLPRAHRGAGRPAKRLHYGHARESRCLEPRRQRKRSPLGSTAGRCTGSRWLLRISSRWPAWTDCRIKDPGGECGERRRGVNDAAAVGGRNHPGQAEPPRVRLRRNGREPTFRTRTKSLGYRAYNGRIQLGLRRRRGGGECPAALGTDTGGTIRIPASLCGIVGLKPTYGRVSKRGVLPLSWSLDHVGPMTRSVEDAAIVLHVIAGNDPQDAVVGGRAGPGLRSLARGGVRGLRIGLPNQFFFENVDPEVEAAVRSAVACWRRWAPRSAM